MKPNRNGADARNEVWRSLAAGQHATNEAVRAWEGRFVRIRWPKRMQLLGSSRKVAKGTKRGYLTAVLYLAPGNRSVAYGGADLCPWRTGACSDLCLGHSSGQLVLQSGQNAEAWKSLLFVHHRSWFLALLADDIRRHVAKAERKGLTPAVRLNGSSDIPWERVWPDAFKLFPTVQFYDYTKSQERALDHATQAQGFPPNYHLTYSRSEQDSDSRLAAMLQTGCNVAIVFSSPVTGWRNTCNPFGEPYHCIDGDKDDLRFLDPPGTVCALSPKGPLAKRDVSGFVVHA